MYPIQCQAGFTVPSKSGKFEITGLHITVNDPTLASEFAIVDDPTIDEAWKVGKILSSLTDQKRVLIHLKGVASVDAVLSHEFGETVKTRHGISIYYTNIKAGSACVYMR